MAKILQILILGWNLAKSYTLFSFIIFSMSHEPLPCVILSVSPFSFDVIVFMSWVILPPKAETTGRTET